MPPLNNDASELMSPLAAELVPPPDGEAADDDEPEPPHTFGGGPVELSLLPLYPDHIARLIWGK